METSLLITAQELHDLLQDTSKKVRVVDGTWFSPNGKKGVDNYLKQHIPGAMHFDLDTCVTPTEYEMMLPSESVFADYVGEMGIDNETHVIIYNDHPTFALFSAPRVWWTFRAFGHTMLSVLDGGLLTWKDAGFELGTGQEAVTPATYTAKLNSSFIRTFDDVKMNIEKKEFKLIDARPTPRFEGKAPEPRDDCKPGHIPGAINVPFPGIFTAYKSPDGSDHPKGAIKSVDDLKAMFSECGVDVTKPMVASCGTGMTACILVFVLHLCGHQDIPVYDGAWLEWFKISTPDMRVQCPGDEDQNQTKQDQTTTASKPEAKTESEVECKNSTTSSGSPSKQTDKSETKPESEADSKISTSSNGSPSKQSTDGGAKAKSCVIL